MNVPIAPMPWSEDVRLADSVVRQQFLESHVGLVRYLALRMASRLPPSVEVEDLVHDGIVGLMDAVDKFDAARGVRFHTYAMARVKGAILDGLRKKDWRPRCVRQGQRQLDETAGRLATSLGRLASEDEIATAMGIEIEEYRDLLQDVSAGPLLSLEELPPDADPEETAINVLPAHRLERNELVDVLADAVKDLPERERRVVELYYHEELNMKEVGAVLGITESRVCQLNSQAAARLRATLQSRLRWVREASANGKTSTRQVLKQRKRS